MTPRITASTPPSDWPLLLTLREVALLLGIHYNSLSRACSAGRSWPPPITTPSGSYQKPLRFSKDTVQAFVEGRLDRPPRYFRRARRVA